MVERQGLARRNDFADQTPVTELAHDIPRPQLLAGQHAPANILQFEVAEKSKRQG
jgi:hypothetical protein